MISREEAKKAMDQMKEAQKTIESYLGGLDNIGGECHCGNPSDDHYDSLFYGHWIEIHRYCMDCGGLMDLPDTMGG